MKTNHRKRKYAFLAALLLLLPLRAAERDCMIVHLQSGDFVVFMLDDNPQILFKENGTEINMHSYQFSEIKKYTFGDSEHLPVGLSDLIVHEPVSMRDGKLIVSVQDENTRLCVYSVLGQEMQLPVALQSDNKTVIDISSLPSGAYVLGIGSETIKFIKR